ncbi:MAG: carbohydrate deacetylase [Gaiellaceae bacterium]
MLIVLNADDFGASEETVRATIECFERGALTSATIMPSMPATEAALAFARAHPEHSFGVHLTFVTDGLERPLADPAGLDRLLGADGRFLPTGEVRRRALLRRIPVAQIERELEAQLAFLRDRGVPISHVDSHRHVHKLAPFREALARVLPRFGIRRVRNVQDVWLRRPLRSPTYWVGPAWRRALMRRFATTEHFYMPTSARDTGWEERLLAAARTLPGSSLEVGVHPGFEEEWRSDERLSVQRLARRALDEGHRLGPWTEVA